MTAWTLLLVVALHGNAHMLELAGFGTEQACTAAAIVHGLEALRWRMEIRGFDCVPGNL